MCLKQSGAQEENKATGTSESIAETQGYVPAFFSHHVFI
jgi:hypothetical protein